MPIVVSGVCAQMCWCSFSASYSPLHNYNAKQVTNLQRLILNCNLFNALYLRANVEANETRWTERDTKKERESGRVGEWNLYTD